MRNIFSALVLVAMTASVAAAGDQAVTGDLARLQGTWTTRAGPNKDIPVSLEIRGTTVIVRVKITRRRSIEAKGELALDEKAAPKAVDWIKFTGADDQEFPEIQAIYELKGDELRVCNGGPNNGRPSEFKPGDGCLADVMMFKRHNPGAPDNHVAVEPAGR